MGANETSANSVMARIVGRRSHSKACAFIGILLAGSSSVVSCKTEPARTSAHTPGSAVETPRSATAANAAPFAETIAGTALTIEMLPVPSSTPAGAPLWMSATEISWDAYDAFVFKLDVPSSAAPAAVDALARPSQPYILMDRGFGHAGYPAISVNHTGAAAFCAWLSHKTGRKYRLPTEDEWERACRAGASGAWCTGDDAAALGDVAWFKGNAERKTHPLRAKAPNAWGFYDMHGNAAEWCTAADGGPVVRGGSYRDTAEGLRASARVEPQRAWNASDPQLPKSKWWLADGGFIGFRIVCEAP